MGFRIEINSILRTDEDYNLKVGEIYSFKKKGSRIFFDDIPVWLTRKDWTALAEISVISQARNNGVLTGEFIVDYIYKEAEKVIITNMFIRMYAGLSDSYIYVLSSQKEYDRAKNEGVLVTDSLNEVGFIHASPKAQLNRVSNKYYKNVDSPLVMIVDKKLIEAEVKWEPATGGLYPHIYGSLNMNAVIKVQNISIGEDGDFHIHISI
ncbi:MAG: DUF952 domain-containing protein [Methylococcaceae bacterium]